jgi:glycosyltransferase involved in cell wall biosynthesis
MPACYAACDVLVLPSTGRETWGLVANEALACGRPIIVSDAVGCASDLAADGAVGRIFPVGNYRMLSGAITAVLDDPPSSAAIQKISDEYGIGVACDGIIKALEFVTSRTSSEI